MSSLDAQRKIGLARTLSKAGFCSRSRATELICAGRVSINGKTRRDPEAAVRAGDSVAVDGVALGCESKTYAMLNKPRGVVTTAADERGRETIYGLLGPDLPWVAPVGRLDKASEGLLLLTNDSEWSARILDPESHLPKRYHVQINRIANHEFVASIVSGVKAHDGLLRAQRARVLREGRRNSWLEIVLEEGKNRHIRRLLQALNTEVLRLIRVSIGPLILGELPKGEYRELTSAEKNALDDAMRKRLTRLRNA
jgi:23S rRNA pseudouridine2605 synthase